MRIVRNICALAFVVLAAPSGLLWAQDISLANGGADAVWHGEAVGALAGFSLDQGAVGAGDNRPDLVVGAPGSGSLIGKVYIIFGGPVPSGSLSLAAADVILTGLAAGDRFGAATAAGNILTLEGSLTRNLVVGAPGALGGRGAVYLFAAGFNGGTRLSASAAVLQILGAPGDQLGTALATGDLNGDGRREIIIGAPGNSRVYIINGSSALSGTIDLSTTAPSTLLTGTGIGSVLAAGDLSGTGLYDVVVGAPNANVVHLLRGRSGGLAPAINLDVSADAHFTGRNPGDQAGATLRIADLDGDGKRDLIIGAPYGDAAASSRPDSGEAYVLFGGAPLASRSLSAADVTIWGIAQNMHIATSLAAGDINRDQPNDLAVLAPVGSGAGDLMCYYGRARNQMGTVLNGTRVVDFASPGEFDRKISGDPAVGPIATAQVFEITGEGARDIIVGVPSADGNTGALYLTISPKMKLTPNTVTLNVNEGLSGSAAIVVSNPSIIQVPWAVTGSTTWLAAAPSTGVSVESASQGFTVTANSDGLGTGSFAGTVNVTSQSIHLLMTQQLAVTLNVTPTRFSGFDAVSGSSPIAQPFTVQGWAIDTNSTSGTGVDAVQLLAYPNPGSGQSPFTVGTATYGLARTDVPATYGSRFANSGFKIIATNVPAGAVRLVVRAHSTVTNTWWTKYDQGLDVTVGAVRSPDDFSGDGKLDLIWQHVTQGWLAGWQMDGTTMVNGMLFTPNQISDTNWRIVATPDFTGDGKPDLLWYHQTTGYFAAWEMNGSTMVRALKFTPNQMTDFNWKIVGAADFTGDGKPDLLWQHTDGWFAAWQMDGVNFVQALLFTPNRQTDPNWKIVAVKDFTGDGKPDLIWQHTDGWFAAWQMDGTNFVQALLFTPNREPDTNWKIVAVGDVNGDGKPDLIWRNQVDGRLRAWLMDGTTLVREVPFTPDRLSDLNWVLVGPR